MTLKLIFIALLTGLLLWILLIGGIGLTLTLIIRGS